LLVDFGARMLLPSKPLLRNETRHSCRLLLLPPSKS
jgi:hypothetical protein